MVETVSDEDGREGAGKPKGHTCERVGTVLSPNRLLENASRSCESGEGDANRDCGWAQVEAGELTSSEKAHRPACLARETCGRPHRQKMGLFFAKYACPESAFLGKKSPIVSETVQVAALEQMSERLLALEAQPAGNKKAAQQRTALAQRRAQLEKAQPAPPRAVEHDAAIRALQAELATRARVFLNYTHEVFSFSPFEMRVLIRVYMS